MGKKRKPPFFSVGGRLRPMLFLKAKKAKNEPNPNLMPSLPNRTRVPRASGPPPCLLYRARRCFWTCWTTYEETPSTRFRCITPAQSRRPSLKQRATQSKNVALHIYRAYGRELNTTAERCNGGTVGKFRQLAVIPGAAQAIHVCRNLLPGEGSRDEPELAEE